jgi:hypothetical protein
LPICDVAGLFFFLGERCIVADCSINGMDG